MNIDNRLYVEAHNKKSFEAALKSDTRIVIVNLQKFGSVREILAADVLQKLAELRIVFLIDEIHRSNSGDQQEEMVSIFDELQNPFDEYSQYSQTRTKKNLIIGFTATPDDHIYRKYKILNRNRVGSQFFKETENLINELCDDFEATIRQESTLIQGKN